MNPRNLKDPVKAGNLRSNFFGNSLKKRVVLFGAIACLVAVSYYFGFAGAEILFAAGPVDGDGKKKKKKKDDSKADDNIKALQKKLTDADITIKKLEADAKKLLEKQTTGDQKDAGELEKVLAQVTALTEQVTTLNTEKRKEQLETLFPDVSSSLLIDKTDDQIEKLVEEQRKIAKKMYGDSGVFTQKTFETVKDVNAAKKTVVENEQMSGEDSAVKVLELGREKSKLLSG